MGASGLAQYCPTAPVLVVMLGTELDALPIEENTGLPFASKKKGDLFLNERWSRSGAQVARCCHDHDTTSQQVAWQGDSLPGR